MIAQLSTKFHFRFDLDALGHAKVIVVENSTTREKVFTLCHGSGPDYLEHVKGFFFSLTDVHCADFFPKVKHV